MARKKKAKKNKSAVVSFRFPEDQIPRLDAHVERLRAREPGGNWTRSSTAMNLVLHGLGQAELEARS